MDELKDIMPWGGMKRCIINPDHSVEGYLDKDNSNSWQGGAEVDWTAVETDGQNVMVEIPKFYFVKKFNDDDRIFGITDNPVEIDEVAESDWVLHPAFFRDRTAMCDDQSATPVEVDFRYAPAFKGWVDGQGRLRSLPNKKPTTDKSIGAFRTHAKNMGVGWTQMDYYLQYAIQMLYITEYGNPDSQTTIGRGYVDGNSGATNTGATLVNGNNTFGETTGKKQMSYRGIEDFWGNISTWVDGYCSDGSRNILIGNKGFNDTGSGYENFGSDGVTANVSGNIRDIHSDMSTGFTIKTVGGNNTTDGLYDNGRLDAARVFYSGGSWSAASAVGAFHFGGYAASGSASIFGSALAL